MLRSTAVTALLILALAACQDDSPAANDSLAWNFVDPRCEALAGECLHRQRGCWLDAEADAAVCRPCAPGHYPTGTYAGCEPIPGTVLHHDFGEWTLEPGEEIGSLCQSWILDNDDELFVNAVELANDGGYHHSNWFFVPEAFRDWTAEPWIHCYNDGFHELDAALAGGVIYAQSTQVRHELQKFQDGAVVRIPPRSRVIGATHLLNYNPQPLTTGLRMTIYALPPEDVTVRLVPAQFVYGDLAIPPEQRSYAGADCDLDGPHRNLFDGAPLDMKIHYFLAHYHDLGHGFDLRVLGGPEDGRRIVDLGAYSAEPMGFTFNPPIDLAGATGLSFGCAFDNPRDEVVRRGIGDQEMCDALLFVEAGMAFSAQVGETTTVETVDEMEHHSGPCGVAAFPFSTGAPRD